MRGNLPCMRVKSCVVAPSRGPKDTAICRRAQKEGATWIGSVAKWRQGGNHTGNYPWNQAGKQDAGNQAGNQAGNWCSASECNILPAPGTNPQLAHLGLGAGGLGAGVLVGCTGRRSPKQPESLCSLVRKLLARLCPTAPKSHFATLPTTDNFRVTCK